MLVGIGFDIHEHSENSELYLAGLKLEGVGFKAHSDGDIILHALCDALLGSVGKKDIGPVSYTHLTLPTILRV